MVVPFVFPLESGGPYYRGVVTIGGSLLSVFYGILRIAASNVLKMSVNLYKPSEKAYQYALPSYPGRQEKI